jgi:hypothetical protein
VLARPDEAPPCQGSKSDANSMHFARLAALGSEILKGPPNQLLIRFKVIRCPLPPANLLGAETSTRTAG